MLPSALRRLGFDPTSASATPVDVNGLVIYFRSPFSCARPTVRLSRRYVRAERNASPPP